MLLCISSYSSFGVTRQRSSSLSDYLSLSDQCNFRKIVGRFIFCHFRWNLLHIVLWDTKVPESSFSNVNCLSSPLSYLVYCTLYSVQSSEITTSLYRNIVLTSPRNRRKSRNGMHTLVSISGVTGGLNQGYTQLKGVHWPL